LSAKGLTICTVLSGESRLGLPDSVYGMDDERDAALIKTLQEIAWRVAATNRHIGIRKP